MAGERGSARRAAAVFVFNHKYEKNVAKLDAMYAGRFADRQFIMPFATSADPRILNIYEKSWTFSGHLAQAGDRLTRDPSISHYAFIADDLVLHPRLDEVSLLDTLNLGPETGYIKSLIAADKVRYRWPWAGEAAMSIKKFGRGFDWRGELPPIAEARRRFEAMGLDFPFPAPRSARELWYGTAGLPRKSPWAFAMGLGVAGQRALYPLLAGYADFVVVPATAIDLFLRYCGVFSAMNVFAEVAIPTALALSVRDVRTELPMGAFFMEPPPPRPGEMRGVEFWKPGEADAFAARLDQDSGRLEREFPADWLYVHPVKLSQWR